MAKNNFEFIGNRWRGQAFTSVLSGLKPLPHLSSAQGGCSSSSSQVRTESEAVALSHLLYVADTTVKVMGFLHLPQLLLSQTVLLFYVVSFPWSFLVCIND